MAFPILLAIKPAIEAAKKLLPVLIKYYKEVLIVSIVLLCAWKYHDMSETISRQKVVIMQDELIIQAHEQNEHKLTTAITDQNASILALRVLSNKQGQHIDKAQEQAESVRNEYDDIIMKLLADKPREIVSCEDNMKWLVDKSGDFKWNP